MVRNGIQITNPLFDAWFATLTSGFEIGCRVVCQNFLEPSPVTVVALDGERITTRSENGKVSTAFNIGWRHFQDTFDAVVRAEAYHAIEDLLAQDDLFENLTIEVFIAAR